MRLVSPFVGLTAVLASGALLALAPAPQASPAEDPAILRIRAHFAQIEREASTYRCRSLDLDGFSAEGGTLEACYAGQELRRLSAIYYGESGRASEKFYFWSDSLEFLVGKSEHYDRTLSGHVVRTEERRLYWDGGKLIRWLKGTTQQPVTGTDAEEAASDARKTARKLAECAADKDATDCEA